ncbi:MAG: LacI family transcriptional regulator, partial [Cellulomonadaceae bacterium]|nr:LacI family transcriptional regulator [Cellulomonadaceae bacterium]
MTRSDVAARAEVSTAVVSYVVNGGPRNVAPATRQRVLDVIAELGYRPNANARALRASTSRTIGLIVPTISNPYFAELSEALEAAAFAQGRTVLVGSSHDDVARETRYLDEFIERRVDGVVLVSVGEDPAIRAALDAEIPVVLLDRPAANLQVPCITIDNEAAGFAATSHLVGHGHTRIACITGPADQAVARARQSGWRRALDGAGIVDLDRMTIAAEFSAVGGYDAARRLLTSTDATAVFVCSDSQSRTD